MRKLRSLPGKICSPALAIGITFALSLHARAANVPAGGLFKEVASFEIARAQARLVRVQALVEQGVLAQKDLDQAQAALDDARDEALLTSTLYGGTHVQDLSVDQARDMVAAAERRVVRQQVTVDENLRMSNDGILSKNE